MFRLNSDFERILAERDQRFDLARRDTLRDLAAAARPDHSLGQEDVCAGRVRIAIAAQQNVVARARVRDDVDEAHA